MQKAILTNSSGFKLTFPCEGRHPRLFLEWLGNHQHKHRTDKFPLQFQISRKAPYPDEIEMDVFEIRFHIIMREDARECVDYINSNLGDE